MVGPVLYQEMLLGSRRGKQYIFRWLYAGWLVVQLLWFYLEFGMSNLITSSGEYATPVVAGWFAHTFLLQQLMLIVLAMPAFAAGAITDEKTRGTLQYLLTADLNARHIVVGKLLGRAAQVAMLALAGLPMLCFIGVFGGVEPVMLLGSLAVTVLPLFALGSATLLASVWSRQTRDAVLGIYLASVPFLILVWLVEELTLFHPVVIGGQILVQLVLATLCVSRLVTCITQRRPVADWLIPAFYAFLGVFLLVVWVTGLMPYFDPRVVLDPAWGSNPDIPELGRRLFWSALDWGSLTAVCLSLAVWQLRPAYISQLEGEGRSKKARWWRVQRMAVADEPIPWKERHVEGLAPVNALRRVPRWLGMLLIFLLTTVSCLTIYWAAMRPGVTLAQVVQMLVNLEFDRISGLLIMGVDTEFLLQGIAAMLLASLIVGIRCSGAVCGEREKQTWEALLLTPLPAKQLIRGKLWGIIGASLPYLLAYAVPALALSLLGGPVPAFWIMIWLGVTFLAMYFVGAAGIWCSVRSKSSWRSLVGTLGIGYVGGVLIYLVTSPVIAILALIILLILFLIDSYLGTAMGVKALGGLNSFVSAFYIASCFALAGIFWGLARYFLADAQKWISERERTRHWKDEPVYRKPRRRTATPRYYR